MLQLGRTRNEVVRENQDLIRETLGVLFDSLIPKSQQIGAIEDAFKARRIQRSENQSRVMGVQILLHASEHFVPILEAGELNMEQTNRLLRVFVNEGWQNH